MARLPLALAFTSPAVLLVIGLAVTTFDSGARGVLLGEGLSTPGPPPGFTPGPGADVPTAPPLPAGDQARCRDTLDLRARSYSLDSIADIDRYVSDQRAALDHAHAVDPTGARLAGVNFRHLMPAGELERLIAVYKLKWSNIFWEASNGVHGAISASVGPQTLDELEDAMKKTGEIGQGDNVVGAYHISLQPTPLKVLRAIAGHEDVLLVDIGRSNDLEAALPTGTCVLNSVPDPLWFDMKRVHY